MGPLCYGPVLLVQGLVFPLSIFMAHENGDKQRTIKRQHVRGMLDKIDPVTVSFRATKDLYRPLSEGKWRGRSQATDKLRWIEKSAAKGVSHHIRRIEMTSLRQISLKWSFQVISVFAAAQNNFALRSHDISQFSSEEASYAEVKYQLLYTIYIINI